MALSGSSVTQLNSMNRAAQNVGLGTLLSTMNTNMVMSGSTLATVSGSVPITIATGLSTLHDFIVQVRQSGSYIVSQYVKAYASGTSIIVSSGSISGSGVYTILAGDKITWTAW